MSRHSSRDDERPADLWYWDDWYASADVKLCSLAAQGLWINVLGFMSRAEIKGALLINGKQISTKDLATLTGKPESEITALMAELQDRGVYSVLPDGTVINRRMYREGEIRRARSEAGRLGGLSSKQNQSKGQSKSAATLDMTCNGIDLLSSQKGEIEGEAEAGRPDPNDGANVQEIIRYLNEKTHKSFRVSSEATAKLIRGRLAEGRTLDDFKKVIDVKASQWLGDPKMDAFLRPDTLFRPSHFESYMNERVIRPRLVGETYVGRSAEKPLSREQAADRDARVKALSDELDRKYAPLEAEAQLAGDIALVKKLKAEAGQEFTSGVAAIYTAFWDAYQKPDAAGSIPGAGIQPETQGRATP